jgi:PAS domain S-box-containing protein
MNTTPVILIVDDEPQGRATLEALLHSSGYRLAFAANGAEALAQTASLTPDLILLDVMMPVMDGFEVCRRLRADPIVAEIPVILLTALDDRDSRLRGIEAGADDFITKPFDRVELRARVQTITRLNRYRRLLLERSKFERLIERAPVGIAIADAQRAIRLANPAFLQMLRAGHATSVIDMDIRSLVAPEQFDACAAWLDGVFARLVHVTRVETEFVRLDGERFPVEIDAGHTTWDEQPAVQLIVHDITERKQAEERIRHAAVANARLYTQAERRLAHVQALRTIDMAITTSLDLRTTLEVILDQVAAQLRVDAADVLLLNPQTQMLEYAAGRGFHTTALQQSHLRLGEGPTGRAALERRTLSIPDLADATD